jgi:hypothetical protein
MHPSSEPQLSTFPRRVRGGGQAANGEPAPVIPRRVAVETERNLAPDDGPAVGVGTTTKRGSEAKGLRRTTGGLFVFGALAFTAAATLLASAFEWPDILRQPASVVLPAFMAGGTSLVWIWFATAWTYAILAVPILLLPAVLGRSADPVLRAATAVGATSVLLSLIGFLRWVFVVPPLAETYVAGDATMKTAIDAAWTAQHQFGGALLGEHLGQLLVIGWSITVSAIIVRTRALPRWLGVAGLAVSAIYLLNQGDILATAVPGFPVWDLAGLIGSTGWGLWVAALGGTLLLRRSPSHVDTEDTRDPLAETPTTTSPATAGPRS